MSSGVIAIFSSFFSLRHSVKRGTCLDPNAPIGAVKEAVNEAAISEPRESA